MSNTQGGGVTILVALTLLVLLTLSALSMSRNSLQDVMSSGTVRQGTEVRNVADSGLDWSCYWLTPTTAGITKGNPEAGAIAFGAVVKTLSGDMELSGEERVVPTTGGVMSHAESDGATRAFSLEVIRMGKRQVEMSGGAPSTGAGTVSRAIPLEMLPDIWSVRSIGTLAYGGLAGMTFQHIREAWVTAPPQAQ